MYEYNWGYEIWVWIAVGVWGGDRVVRLVRTARNGVRAAKVSAVEGSGGGGEYLRIEVDGVRVDGVVYLCFRTLRRWMFWENHPFSVVSSFADSPAGGGESEGSSGVAVSQPSVTPGEKSIVQEEARAHPCPSPSGVVVAAAAAPRATFTVRVRNGVTGRLAGRLAASSSPDNAQTLRLPVLVEGSYRYAASSVSRLRRCEALLCIAGGVGVTALLPLLRGFLLRSPRSRATKTARLVWGVRDGSLPAALASQLAGLGGVAAVETSVGARVDMRAVLRDEMAAGCGPPGMADDVRAAVAELRRSGRRAVVFVDEAFGW